MGKKWLELVLSAEAVIEQWHLEKGFYHMLKLQ